MAPVRGAPCNVQCCGAAAAQRARAVRTAAAASARGVRRASARAASQQRRTGVRCAARSDGADGQRAALPPPPPPPEFDDDGFEDFPGADSARQWRQLPQDTRSILQIGFAFVAIPVLLSASLRLSVIDPLLFYVQADLHEFDLTRVRPRLARGCAT